MLQREICEGEKVEGTLGKKKEKKRETARVWTRGALMKTAKVETLSTPKADSQGKDPRTLKEPVERWRVVRKRKEKTWRRRKRIRGKR